MKFLLGFLLVLPTLSFSQRLKEFNLEKITIDKKLMVGLGAWSVANIGVGTYGWATTENEAKYFHQMNVLWGGVNLALALPGYLNARKADPSTYSFAETWRLQSRTEKIFLFNTALDLFYVTGGFYLKQRALTDVENYHRYRGWGNSLVMQGGFLFLFDMAAVIVHNRHRKNKLDGFLENIELSNSGIGLTYKFGQHGADLSFKELQSF